MSKTATATILTVSRDSFARELEFVAGAIESKTTIPILSNVKLAVEGDVLRLTATSLDVTAQSSVSLAFPSEGAACVDLKRLAALVKKLSAREIEIGLQPGKLEIKAGRSKFNLPTLPAEDFPAVETVEGVEAEIPSVILRGVLDAATYAVDKEDHKTWLLKALELAVRPTCVQATGSNDKIFSRASVACDNSGAPEFRVPLARPFFPALSAFFKRAEGNTTITSGEHGVKFACGPRAVSGRLIAGKLPPYDTLFSKTGEALGKCNRRELQDALNRLLVLADDTEKALKPVSFTINGGSAEISTDDARAGGGVEVVDIAGGLDGYRSRFNAHQLSQTLSQSQGEDVHLVDLGNAINFLASWPLADRVMLSYSAIAAILGKPQQAPQS